MKDLGRHDITGCIDEDHADQKQHNTYKDRVDPEDALVRISFYHLGHLDPALAHGDHSGEIIMHRAADDTANGDGDEGYGTEEYTLDGTQDRTCSRDV